MKHKNHSKKLQRTDPLYDGYEHIANSTKMLKSSDTAPFRDLEKHTGSLVDALRYVGSRAKMPRVNPAEEERKKSEERLCSLVPR
jgi:hypothetical protein